MWYEIYIDNIKYKAHATWFKETGTDIDPGSLYDDWRILLYNFIQCDFLIYHCYYFIVLFK